MDKTKSKTVDEYLNKLPEQERKDLERLRKIIKREAPKAEELISYRMPAYKYKGMFLSFAAFKEHCSLFVMSRTLLNEFKKELKDYYTSIGTIRFTTEKPLPAALVKKIIKAKIKENETRFKSKKRC
jgi:uncharacterized protein YdhG (YjbR/CyaY superfamily)